MSLCVICIYFAVGAESSELQSRSQSVLSKGDIPHDQCILSHELAICFWFLSSWHNFIQWDNESDSAFSQQFPTQLLALCSRVLLPLYLLLLTLAVWGQPPEQCYSSYNPLLHGCLSSQKTMNTQVAAYLLVISDNLLMYLRDLRHWYLLDFHAQFAACSWWWHLPDNNMYPCCLNHGCCSYSCWNCWKAAC